jgi:hypothetical protein
MTSGIRNRSINRSAATFDNNLLLGARQPIRRFANMERFLRFVNLSSLLYDSTFIHVASELYHYIVDRAWTTFK